MSNKAFNKLNPLDVLIQQTLALGMNDGVFLKIEYIYGFEKFNTRPYHNYETWAGGYRITDERNNIRYESEDLDDALYGWADIVKRVKTGEEFKLGQRHYNVIPPKEVAKSNEDTTGKVSA